MVQQLECALTAKKNMDMLSECLAATPEKVFNQDISNSESNLQTWIIIRNFHKFQTICGVPATLRHPVGMYCGATLSKQK